MYRIRLHGRGGQGMKTAGRVLGSAFFAEGFEVQDAPRYGAERRGAPIFATVRASRRPIHERGPIRAPDLVLVADDTLLTVAAAGVLQGFGAHTVLVLASHTSPETWRERLRLEGPIFVLPAGGYPAGDAQETAAGHFVGSAEAATAARLTGAVRWPSLEQALREELAAFGEAVVLDNVRSARAAWDRFAPYEGCVHEGPEAELPAAGPDWVELPFEPASVSAPDIHAGVTSVEVRTGLWRTMRPVIDHDRCHRCTWICSTFCPDGAIDVDPEGAPRIDYDHCKGCLVCVAVCPPHAIRAVAEREAAAQETA